MTNNDFVYVKRRIDLAPCKGMVWPDRAPLRGVVEADETHVGGPAKGREGRGVWKLEKHNTPAILREI
jgi:hypothetical protein